MVHILPVLWVVATATNNILGDTPRRVATQSRTYLVSTRIAATAMHNLFGDTPRRVATKSYTLLALPQPTAAMNADALILGLTEASAHSSQTRIRKTMPQNKDIGQFSDFLYMRAATRTTSRSVNPMLNTSMVA